MPPMIPNKTAVELPNMVALIIKEPGPTRLPQPPSTRKIAEALWVAYVPSVISAVLCAILAVF